MKKSVLHTGIFFGATIVLFLLPSCDRKLDNALNAAKENRSEIEAVLNHFSTGSDVLRYDAAKFLIENMPYHYSYIGKGMEEYDSIYSLMAKEPKQFRDSVFREMIEKINFKEKRPEWDIETVSAEQLIEYVEKACSVWQEVEWRKDYPIHLFLDYVLPYRVFEEQPSNWYETIDKEYPYLKSNTVWSKKGIWWEAERAVFCNARKMYFGNAFNDSVVMLDSPNSMVTFNIYSPLPAIKNLYIRYSSTATDRFVNVLVNGGKSRKLHLDPTKAMTVFRTNRTELEIKLKKGDNQISVQYGNGQVGIDNIQLVAVESLVNAQNEDFSKKYFRISNKGTGRYISFDTISKASSDTIRLRTVYEGPDNSVLIQMDYRGYASWSISSPTGDNNLCLTTNSWVIKENGPVFQSKYQNGNHQKWIFIPTDDGCYKIMGKDNGLFLRSETKENGEEILISASYTGGDSQKWKIEQFGEKPCQTAALELGSAIDKASKITDIMPQFEWFSFPGSISLKASSLCKERTGICRDEAAYTVYLCRYMGVPSAVDFTPHWGNRSSGHLWSVLIRPDGTSIPFYMGRTPGDTVHEYHTYIKPKVFRHRFQLNHSILEDMKGETEIPRLFQIPNFTDVSKEYFSTTDIVRNIPEQYSEKKVAYICVFENPDWVPVHYGRISQGQVEFRSMGRGIIYIAAFYENGNVNPFGNPFFVDESGIVHDIEADTLSRQNLDLLRKHPFLRINDRINNFMSGGKFQGSNTSDFSTATDLYIHKGKTTGNWYDIKIEDKNEYKYLRYIGPDKAYCNINEIRFYDTTDELIKGKIIGTKGEKGMEKEKVFDNDILTTFQGLSRSGHWVGLKLSRPTQVGRIRYIGRNDGNCIEIGDEYELCYWVECNWKSCGKQIAQSDTLTYKNVPSGGLYILRNLTKGKEERIFTYEDGKQVWW